MTQERSESRDVEAMRQVVIAAARVYRDAMRTYLAGQLAAIDGGASLNELVLRNQGGFQQAARAEEELFALLDRLDGMETMQESEACQETGHG